MEIDDNSKNRLRSDNLNGLENHSDFKIILSDCNVLISMMIKSFTLGPGIQEPVTVVTAQFLDLYHSDYTVIRTRTC